MLKILFVCLGNICRSPIAQGIFQDKIEKDGLSSKIHVDSAGTSSWHQGEKPDRGSIKVSKSYGIDISDQKSRPVSINDKKQFDYLIAMDKANFWTLKNEFMIPDEKLFLIRSFDNNKSSEDVPDPYGMAESAFEEVYKIIERSIDNFFLFLKEKHPDIFQS